jgi:hypothetical protein
MVVLNMVSGGAVLWVLSYLYNRKQSVETGIPQGSILGPFLYLVFAYDPPKTVYNFKLITYTDDITLLCKHPIQTNLFEMLKNLSTMNS